jgi:ribonuclease J
VEVEAREGSRIVLDLGRPLDAAWEEQVQLPDVAGLRSPDPSLLGVLISHPHADHYGLAGDLEVEVPIYLGEEAARLLAAASFFSPVSATLDCAGHLRHRTPFELGPFTITPFLADHSGFDAYSLLVEADGQRLFYTGDLRGHGRKAALFEQLLQDPPTWVDVVLMEGTHVRSDLADDEVAFQTEAALEERSVAACRATDGAVVVFGSAQNLDRLVTVYRAAKRSDRLCVVDLYGATVAAATRDTIPQPGFDALRVYVPQRQRVRVKQSGEFHRVAAIAQHRVFPEDLAREPGRFLLPSRPRPPASSCAPPCSTRVRWRSGRCGTATSTSPAASACRGRWKRPASRSSTSTPRATPRWPTSSVWWQPSRRLGWFPSTPRVATVTRSSSRTSIGRPTASGGRRHERSS